MNDDYTPPTDDEDSDVRDIDETTGDSDEIREGESLIPKLPQDNDVPFSDPTDPISDTTADIDVREEANEIDPTNEVTDNTTDIDSHQRYDEGLAGAAEFQRPNAGNAVVGYDPDKDQRKHPQE